MNGEDIAWVKWNDRDQGKDFHGNPDSRLLPVCAPLVRETAFALGKLLKSMQEEKG